MAAAIVLTVFAGFSRTFYLRPYFQTERLSPLLAIHGIVFSSWIALFVAQTTLVATRSTRTHMRLGMVGGMLAILMLIVGTFTAIVRAKGPSPLSDTNSLAFLTVPIGDMLVFGVLVGGAFYFRRRVDTHKRLMLLATIALLPPALGRLPIGFIQAGGPLAFYGLANLFLVPCAIHDFAKDGRPHRATILGTAFILAMQPLRVVIGTTPAWISFATWLTHWT